MNYRIGFVVTLLLVRGLRIYSRIAFAKPYKYRPGVCEFPSIYRDKVITQCQLSADGHWWCPVDENLDVYNRKSLCPNTSLTYAGSDPGRLCHLPFVYNGRTHSTCIRTEGSRDHSVYWWCATTANYDQDVVKRWTRCHEQSDQLPCFFSRTGAVGISAECRHFNTKWVCHTERSEIRECPRTETTFAGNSPGQQCHFPFLFGNTEYRSCISARRTGRPLYGEEGQFESFLWCSTTANYDVDRRWTKCVAEEHSQYWKDRRILIPVSIILGMIMVVFCVSTMLHFCCDRAGRSQHKQCISISSPCHHQDISMRQCHANKTNNDTTAITPSAPPSYLEAVMTLDCEL